MNYPPDTLLDCKRLIRYEQYDYVLLVCRNEVDYNKLLRSCEKENVNVIFPFNKYGVNRFITLGISPS